MPVGADQIKRTLVDVCHRLCAKGFVTATDGNVSVRLPGGSILTTRSGINKGMVTVEDFVEVDRHGAVQTAIRNSQFAKVRPSTELGMHLYIYSQRPDVHAVVHAHPTYATGFAVARQPMTDCVLPEVIVGLGAIPLAEYATPSTREVAASLAPYVKHASAILLANHGVVTYGKDVYDAYYKMEKVEHAAQILFVAKMLGGEKLLSSSQIEQLKSISDKMYGKQILPQNECNSSDSEKTETVSVPDEDILTVIKQMLQTR
jgi:L-fuculose-phosphate aldolase